MTTRKIEVPPKVNMDLHEVFKIPKTVMEIFGLWPQYHKGCFKKVLKVASIIVVFIFWALLAAECTHVNKDFISFLKVLTVSISVLSYLLKQLIFSMNESKFLDISDSLNDKMFTTIPKHMSHMIQEPIQLAQTIGTLYVICGALTIVLFIVIPLGTEKGLPFSLTVIELGVFHPTMYLFQSLSLWTAAANNSCIDVAFVGVACVINGQLNVLKNKICSLDGKEDCNLNEDAVCYLRKCVKHHIKIIELVEKIEKMFSTIMLIQYLSSIMEICNTGFQLVIVEMSSVNFFVMIFYFMTMMCQLGMYCGFGNEIIVNSSAIRDACYESDWINYNAAVRKMLMIIVERSKRPMYLTVGNFSVLSLQSFTSVINSAYSFFALMQRISEDK